LRRIDICRSTYSRTASWACPLPLGRSRRGRALSNNDDDDDDDCRLHWHRLPCHAPLQRSSRMAIDRACWRRKCPKLSCSGDLVGVGDAQGIHRWRSPTPTEPWACLIGTVRGRCQQIRYVCSWHGSAETCKADRFNPGPNGFGIQRKWGRCRRPRASAMGNGLPWRETCWRYRRWYLRQQPHPWRRGAGEVESSGSSLERCLDRSRG
jgi:hypothetical protein